MPSSSIDSPTIERVEGGDASAAPAIPTTSWVRMLLASVLVLGPLVMAVVVASGTLGDRFPLFNLALAAVLYVIVGHGVTIGFHRLFAHRSFTANRPLKIALGIAGSLSFQGSLINWVADHRRHHRYSDLPGDPHSPVWGRSGALDGWRGLWHAHAGWFFTNDPTSREAYAEDLLADPDIVRVDRLFPLWSALSLLVPFGIGYAVTGTLAGALGTLLWAGVLRVGFGHHFTWSINSVCHHFGKRPFRTKDRSTNVAALALLTAGESFHNAHHAFPTLARHGVEPRQIDTSAAMIRLFERLHWARDARWPVPALLDARRS